MQPGILSWGKRLMLANAQRFLFSALIFSRKVRVIGQQGGIMAYSPGLLLRLVSLSLLSLLAGACLTTKSANAPAFRGLTDSETQRLETIHHHNIQDKSSSREKDDSPENLAEMAEIFLQNGDYESSLYNYSKILSQNPERHDIRYKLGVALLLTGKLEEAKKELAEVLLHQMDMLEAHEALGVVYLQENNLTAAQQEFRFSAGPGPEAFPVPLFIRGDLFAG